MTVWQVPFGTGASGKGTFSLQSHAISLRQAHGTRFQVLKPFVNEKREG